MASVGGNGDYKGRLVAGIRSEPTLVASLAPRLEYLVDGSGKEHEDAHAPTKMALKNDETIAYAMFSSPRCW